MKVSNDLWKDRLAGEMPDDLAREIENYETDLNLRKQGKVEEKLFAETRLRRGVYGQRYDNGNRHDGKKTQTLPYPESSTKGPSTMWDAPGMQRIKIPAGGLDARQLEALADIAEEYSDGIAHVTTRQDFQLHFVHIDDTPALMRRLAAVGITTREACGNSVRNVTCCPFAGVCRDELFDVTPYARALSRFLLGHPDCQDFGRKFKPALSGCKQHACGLVAMHDLGLIAAERRENGAVRQGFELYVGGGLGAIPYQAKLFSEFVTPEELFPTAQAIARVFARLGEKKNRSRARIKFLVSDLGIEKFRELVLEERKVLPHDPAWTGYLESLDRYRDQPLRPPGKLPAGPRSDKLERWLETNVQDQRQEGYAVATVTLPLGDITSLQLRALADIARRFTGDTIRTTVEQNFVLRWVSKADLPALHQALDAFHLGEPGAGSIVDIVACPGTDTCKLGISSSRGLAAELRKRLEENWFRFDQAIKDLHIKVSGCFNSCGQHHAADLGFYGVSRRVGNYKVPHFQLLLGGEWENNAGAYGLTTMVIPSKRVPEAVSRIIERFARERRPEEKFKDFTKRIGKVEVKKMLEDLLQLPDYQTDPFHYSDWGDPREYTTGDIATGECAGEVVPRFFFELADAERECFEAGVHLEKEEHQQAGTLAYQAMLHAARALVKTEFYDVPDDGDRIVGEFRARFYDTRKFFDPFAGGKFAHFLFAAHERRNRSFTAESASHLFEEAQLFIEAAHSCYNRLEAKPAPAAASGIEIKAEKP